MHRRRGPVSAHTKSISTCSLVLCATHTVPFVRCTWCTVHKLVTHCATLVRVYLLTVLIATSLPHLAISHFPFGQSSWSSSIPVTSACASPCRLVYGFCQVVAVGFPPVCWDWLWNVTLRPYKINLRACLHASSYCEINRITLFPSTSVTNAFVLE